MGQVIGRATRTRRVSEALVLASLLASSLLATPSSATGSLAGAALSAPAAAAAAAAATDTTFKSLPVGAGGYVTGMSFSDDGATRVVRTDGFGGYRWAGDRWELNVSASSLPSVDVRPGLGGGVLAFAVAPSNGAVAYMAYNHGVYRSDDAARTWRRVLSGVSTAANDDFRTWGSRLTVDPRNPDVVYYGTQLDGLRTTRDGGASWSTVPVLSVPRGLVFDLDDTTTRGELRRPTDALSPKPHLATAGISAIAVDRSGPVKDGRSQVVYAASYGQGVYRSADAGLTWSRTSPATMGGVGYLRVLDNGDVLATSHANPTDLSGPADVWRLRQGQWARSGPTRAGNWRGIAADPHNPGWVALIAAGGQLALSRDYGSTWSLVTRTQSSAGDVPWLAWALDGGTNWMSPGELTFDPVKAGRLWLTEGTGVWYADVDATSTAAVHWVSQSRGIEQLVPTDVVAPPGGKPLLTAWDRPIFRSEDPDAYPTHYGPVNRFGSAWSVDWSVTDPSYVVASVASHQWPSDPSTSGYSTDGGRTWSRFASIPEQSTNAVTTFGFGSMAVGAPGNIVWIPAYGKRPAYTQDGGTTWKPVVLPGLANYSLVNHQPHYVNRRVLAADKTAPGTFYLFVLNTGVYRTTDGGDTWVLVSDNTPMRNTNYAWNAMLKAVPGHQGELYLTPGQLTGTTTQPFQHSTDGGATWTTVTGVTGVSAFGFGAPFPGTEQPTIFIAGYVRGVYGIHRSTDGARTWTYLTDYPAGRTPFVTAIDGDKTEPGRVYVAVGGSGWTYGSLGPAGVGQADVTAQIQAPTEVGAGESFAATVTVQGATPQDYQWSVSGCSVAAPTAAATRVTCGRSLTTQHRTLNVTARLSGSRSITTSTTVLVRTPLVSPRWSRLHVVGRSLRARLTTSSGSNLPDTRVRLQVRRQVGTAWRVLAGRATDSQGVVRFPVPRQRSGTYRMVVRGEPGLRDARSRPRFVRAGG